MPAMGFGWFCFRKISILRTAVLVKTTSTVAVALAAGSVALITNSQAKELNYWLAGIAVVLFGLFTRMTVGAMKQIDKDLDELKRLDQ
jgi:hypothetical protein